MRNPLRIQFLKKQEIILISVFLVMLASCSAKKNVVSLTQNPSPMQEYIRSHARVSATACEGRRWNWQLQNKKVQLFVPKNTTLESGIDLIIHFHGLSKVTEFAICKKNTKVMLTISGGFGSSSYEKLFINGDNFTDLLYRTKNELGISQFSSITLSGWSAGYGAIRALLMRYEEDIDNILLLDGLHASYIPENKVLYEGGEIDSTDMYAFHQFAKKAAGGEKKMLITHSSIFPGTYASTTECTQYLIEKLNLKRRSKLQQGPVGMQQVGEVSSGNLNILSYAGNTAPDHIDHLHGLAFFLIKIFED
jgi:hypothetical protein